MAFQTHPLFLDILLYQQCETTILHLQTCFYQLKCLIFEHEHIKNHFTLKHSCVSILFLLLEVGSQLFLGLTLMLDCTKSTLNERI